MNIFDEIKKLNFPIDEYVVVGGAAMMARGIKETQDIDLVVKSELFEKCHQNGWKSHPRPNGELGLEKDIVEIYLNVNCGNFNPTFQELRAKADVIKGVPFCSLEDGINFKREYNREKDLKDIQLINDYINANGRRTV